MNENERSITRHLRMHATSRRHFLRAGAIAGTLATVTALAPSSIAGIALAQAAAQADGDLGILNYALTLEHLENALYRALLQSGLLTGDALGYAKSFGSHENTHVQALTKTITDLGGTPVAEQAAYSFPMLKTEAEVIKTLAEVEDLGASAYLGAAALIQDPDLLTVAVQIHTNEAEHATTFRYLAGMDPVPTAFAEGKTMDEVVAAVTPFLMMPATMPNTAAGDSNTLRNLALVGGLAATAVGAGLLSRQAATVTNRD